MHAILFHMDFQQKSPEEIIRSLKNKFNFNKSKKTTLPLIIGILVVISLLKGAFYTIQPSEVGVILRFGKVIKTTSPGLHFKLPF